MNGMQYHGYHQWLFPFAAMVLFSFCQPGFSQDPARFQQEINQIKGDKTDYTSIDDLVLFTGSSSVRIWTDVKTDFPGIQVVNTGFGGSHMSDLLFYADTLIIRYRPARIFIYEGDNDIASGKNPDDIIKDAGRLVQLVRQKLPQSILFFIAAKPSPSRWNLKDVYGDYNRKLMAFSSVHPGVFYIDVWDKMTDSRGKPRGDLFLPDSLHMNRRGYDLWRSIIGEFINAGNTGRPVAFGVCTGAPNAGILRKAGFGYLEGSVGRDLMPSRPGEEFAKKMQELDTCGLPMIACNGFLPATLKVCGPDAQPDTVLRYAEVAFRRAASVGIRTIVFGSSGSRSIPEGFDRQEARDRFISLLKRMGPIARKYGVTIAIENLQKSESNFINTVSEAVSIAKEVKPCARKFCL
jgi:lysophospholipase L1-like esterase